MKSSATGLESPAKQSRFAAARGNPAKKTRLRRQTSGRPGALAASAVGAALLCLGLMAGCSSAPQPAEPPSESPAAVTSSKVILAVSFGTSYDNNRELSIGGIEGALKTAYPDYEIRRAFTAQTIIDILDERGMKIDNVTQAMDKLVADGVKDVVIQPTMVMSGFEYNDLASEAEPYKDKFDSFAIGAPLLTSEADFQTVAQSIVSHTASYAADGAAVVFMGHGTDAPSNADYAKLQTTLTELGFDNYFIGTVEAVPTVEDVIAAAKQSGATKAVLLPLMVVAGDHANNDMAGDEPDSWKSQFEAAGFEVECVLEGLGQNPDIQKLYVEHAKAAIDQAAGSSGAQAASDGPTAAVAIPASKIQPGTYSIDAVAESSMFKIVDAQLTAENGVLSVVVTLSGDGYGRLFLGTADEAAQAADGFIEFTSDSEGRHIYTVPVDALDKPVSIAAESGKTPGKFYDQIVTFSSARLPAAAVSA
ncbi:MAG: sirohydrochlorin cobaltochelatase [Propionibacteriaceae bacterium]|jgi:sirohydrochlorin cobaltochelatase|nr:sirohydrochlorin cobaltochelatase [Propionibacteriaceae bacterium]